MHGNPLAQRLGTSSESSAFKEQGVDLLREKKKPTLQDLDLARRPFKGAASFPWELFQPGRAAKPSSPTSLK